MDLFEYAKSKTLDQESPLASRLRPTTLDEVVGQQHIIGKNTLLYRAIKADKLTSVIFYGPPGTGKTTLAKVIANTTSAEFTQINATVAGKKDMEAVVKEAQQNLGMYGKKTILFIDEIHRFNKGQQDYLLPFVEDGTIILIGATTENPYFEVNAALISRSIIFELKSLEISEVKELILRAVNDKTKGMGNYKAQIDEDALDFLADMAGGDARNALKAIELGILTTPRSEDGLIHITDLSWGRVDDPHKVVELDQKINVVILDFDDDKKRIALGLKQLTPHPWDALDADLKVGDKVSGKVVVIADFNLCRSDSIVLINYRNDIVIEQRTQGVAGVQEAFTVFHISTGQQHLPDVNAINRKQLFPQLNQSTLPYRRQQLFRGDGRWQFRVTQVLTSGGDRARRHNNNPMPGGM